MILLIQNIDDYNNDLRVSLQAFYGMEKIVDPEKLLREPYLAGDIDKLFVAHFEDSKIDISMYNPCSGDMLRSFIEQPGRLTDGHVYEPSCTTQIKPDGDCHDRKRVRDPLKLSVYNMLSKYTGRSLPWGCLTGVRPAKIAVSYLEDGLGNAEIVQKYQNIYGTSKMKAELAAAVAVREKKIIESVSEEDEYCLYIGIPFCPTRCLYCSFTSYPIGVYKDRVDAYLDALNKEMGFVAEAYRHKKLISIYIGGGTPSSISAQHMDRLCHMIEASFDMGHIREYTIEAGRPDSITLDKLEVMQKHHITRISINPQTMNGETLRTIGRAHTPEQTVLAMELARKAGFDNINMDLIVGLPGEDEHAVRRTLSQISRLGPESLTVHTLAIKRAANLNQQMDMYRESFKNDIEQQLSAVTETAKELGLEPYYLYRQKNMAGNLENVGYSREGRECLYNILIMEERQTIVALGAGSVTKRVFPEGRIERCENVKDVEQYMERIDEMIERKRNLFAE